MIGVRKDGESSVRGYGTIDRTGGSAPDGATVFQIGSLSKLFTATTMQILADEGVLDPEATLGETLDGIATPSASARAVTLRQLATHTSGFPRVPRALVDETLAVAGEAALMRDPYSHLEPDRVFACLEDADDLSAPGGFAYSNLGMGLLGHVMEHVTGRDLESLITGRLLDPLGLRDTAITLTPSMRARLAQGHDADGAPAPLWTFAALGGAGAFAATADDLLRYVAANLDDTGPLRDALSEVRRAPGDGEGGIGWMRAGFLERLVGNGDAVWHNGQVGGYASYLSIDPESATGVVILSSKALDLTMHGTMLTRHVRTRSWARQTRGGTRPG